MLFELRFENGNSANTFGRGQSREKKRQLQRQKGWKTQAALGVGPCRWSVWEVSVGDKLGPDTRCLEFLQLKALCVQDETQAQGVCEPTE